MNSLDPETLIGTEFVASAAWTGIRPEHSILEDHLKKAEIDLFRLPKEFVDKINEDHNALNDTNMDDTIMEEKNKLVKDSFPVS